LNRQKIVDIAYQKGNELNLTNKNYVCWLNNFFNKIYYEDVGVGDLTSDAILTQNKLEMAFLKFKEQGTLGGLEEVSWFLKNHNLEVEVFYKDGEEIPNGETILLTKGKQKSVLATERICLNVLQRMSGIATETKRLTELLRNENTRIAATRKTLLPYIDKKAVFVGGGLTHRFGLWDSIMIKDNHLNTLKNEGTDDYVDVALNRASIFADRVSFIEIEVTTFEEAIQAGKKFKDLNLKIPCIVMLDNMMPSVIRDTIEALRQFDLYNFVLLEASGDITRDNIKEYAHTGVDVISLGYITHSPKVIDLNLEMAI
jgi:nicotinate-nucleotide pyrophosphorylase (carboxylating)